VIDMPYKNKEDRKKRDWLRRHVFLADKWHQYDREKYVKLSSTEEGRAIILNRNRKTYKNYVVAHPEKIKVRRTAQDRINLNGKTCEDCGTTINLHRHHPDYNKPLEVKILCGACHGVEHRV